MGDEDPRLVIEREDEDGRDPSPVIEQTGPSLPFRDEHVLV